MALCCSLSNEVPDEPVLSPVSGNIFERRLIVKYIKDNSVDPINGKDLSEDMLIEVKVPSIVKPKPPSATSIPAILKTLQDEWDAVMLHSFTLRQQLQTARTELSHALYQHDAACRVIARLTKELTGVRETLSTLKPKAIAGGYGEVAYQETANAAAEDAGISAEVTDKLDNKAAVLTADRKKRGKSVPEELVKTDELRNFKTLASHSGLHSASVPCILALDICL